MKYDFGCDQLVMHVGRGRFVTIDMSDAPLVRGYRWRPCPMPRKEYAKTWYAQACMGPRSDRTSVMMHRLIFGAAADQFIDHADGNGLNNRRSNLRVCTRSRNMANRCAMGISGLKGVRVVAKKGDRFMARIGPSGETIIGRFPTADAAARAYDEAARKMFREFACLNHPNPGERSALTGEIVPIEQKQSA